MKKSVKIILVAAAVFSAVLIIAVITAIILFPGDRIKAMIEKQASAIMEMPVTIGSVGLSFTGLPAVRVSDISVGPAREGEPALFSVGSIRARVDIMALLKRNIEIVSVDIDRPSAMLLTRNDGSRNFVFSNTTAFTMPALPFAISMKSLTIDGGSVVIADKKAETQINLDDIFYRISVDIAGNFKSMTAGGKLAVKNISFFTGENAENALIEGIELRFVHTVSGDPIEGNLALTQGDLTIGDMPVTIQAEISGFKKTAFSVSTGKNEADKLLKLIPPSLFPEKNKATIGGAYEFSLTGTADMAPEKPVITFSGALHLDGITAVIPETLRHPATLDGSLSITPSNLSIDGLTMKTGVSDIAFSGAMTDYMALAFPREGEQPVFKGLLSSTTLNLNDMLTEANANTETASEKPTDLEEMLRSLPIPPSLTIDTGIDLGTVIFGKLKADSIVGSIGVSKGVMKLDNLAIKAYHGALLGKAVLAVTGKDITYNGDLKLDRLDAGAFLASFFGTGEDIFGGTLSGSLSFGGAGLEKAPMLKNLTADGSFSIENGQIRNWEFTKNLGKTLQFLDFDTLGFDRISTSFKVADGRVITDDLAANTEYGAFSLSGDIGFDTTLDYDIAFKLNGAAVSLAKKNNLGLISELLEDETGTPVLNLKAGGSLRSPTFAIDTSKAADRAKERIKKEAEKLLGEKADKLLGNQGEQLKKEGKKLLKKIFK